MPLPVDAVVPALLEALRRHGSALLDAPPGAGKTTRVPPALAAARPGSVVVLEPRRVAARAAARRIAAETGWRLGEEVGWWIRFDRRFGPRTRVLFVTEGLGLRWLQRDPFLEGIGTLVFDEFHERALAADLALAFARQVQRDARPDLGIVVMSATLDPGPLGAYLDGAPTVRSEGRAHPVTTRWLDHPDDRPLEVQVAVAARRALRETEGDVLAFLPGRAEIRRAEAELATTAAERDLLLAPLYGDLPIEDQDAALRTGAKRRIVLATNVAETSVTVTGVHAVVDSGLARQLRFDPATGLDRLETVRIARAAADQRAGRAGREAPGLCLRLWTAADDRALRPFEPPEVRRVDLAGAVLEVAAWGEPDARRFPWFEPPDPARLERAIAELGDLGALAPSGITPLGRRLAALPLAPRLGKLLLEGERLGVEVDAALAVALLSERGPFRSERRTGRASSRSDLLDRLDSLRSTRTAGSHALFRLGDEFLGLLRRTLDDAVPVPSRSPADSVSRESRRSRARAAPEPRPPLGAEDGDRSSVAAERKRTASPGEVAVELASGLHERRDEALLRAVGAAFLDRLCRRRERGSDRAVMVGGRGVRLARESTVRDAELFVALELDAGRGRERAEGLVRAASAVERSWLPEELLGAERELLWDAARERVVGRAVVRFEDLVLEDKEVPVEDADAAAALLAERAAAELARAFGLGDEKRGGLGGRVAFLTRLRPELGLPRVEERLRELLPNLVLGRRSFAELRSLPSGEIFLGSLERVQRRALEEEAPERIEVPSGSRIQIDYADPERPLLAVRIQELFGLAETPRIGGGRVPLLLHLLAPNGRPQQVTDDLASFWANTYPQVRKELAGRYPKHAWPVDPGAARPNRGARRRG
ncbi:MAG: ATP-dependent helicase HrpB [Holophagales bacterium]|nr:ATP-dependent helicase HrpB [Holophagales bacterium]